MPPKAKHASAPKKTVPPKQGGYCPNPQCTSHGRFFPNIQRHISQKLDCLEFLQALRKQVISKSLSLESQVLHPTRVKLESSNNHHQSILKHNSAPEMLPIGHDDDPLLPETHDDSPAPSDDGGVVVEPQEEFSPPSIHDDFEQHTFNCYMNTDNDNYLINPSPTFFTNARRVEVTLLKILTEIEAPLWTFKVIMEWASDAYQTGYQFLPHHDSYQTQMLSLSKWVGMDHMQPKEVQVSLPGKRPDDKIPVTTFDFISQLHSLLSDKILNTSENLVINKADPFTRYEPPDGLLHEALSGSWYRDAWAHMEANTNCNFMIPIILYIDKTQMSLSGKLSIFPVHMSLSIFTEVVRRTSRAWRPLGYIANEDYYYSAAERNVNDADTKSERFHTQLHEILRSFKDAQQPGGFHNALLQLGNKTKTVNLYVPLQFIIGDAEGGDQLVGRQSYRGDKAKRLCRTCDVSFANCARTDIDCNRIRLADMKALVSAGARADLFELRQRPGYNALYDIDCGNDPYGVFSMIHTEGLHALEAGLIEYMLEILMQEIPKRSHDQLDALVKRLLNQPKQHGYDTFPRLLWADGVTTLTQLTGDLKVGKMFAITAVALTVEGRDFFTENLPGGLAMWKKMVYVFQQILCYWAWLKKDTYWMANDLDGCASATRSIKIMMRQLQVLWPRENGFCWNITKLHEQFHVPFDIQRMGRHKNVHTGPQEHNHIDTKDAAKKTQLNKKKIDFQTGARVMERLVIQRAYDFVQTSTLPRRSHVNPIVNASKGSFKYQSVLRNGHPTVQADFSWNKRMQHYPMPLSLPCIHQLLIDEYFNNRASPSTILDIPFYTQYERNNFIYRAHPSFRQESQWYDWAYVKWVTTNPVTGVDVDEQYSARILGFITDPIDNELKAIIHSVKEAPPNRDNGHGIFGFLWNMETVGVGMGIRPKLRIVSVDTLMDHTCMFQFEETNPYCWFHIWNQNTWPDCFNVIEANGGQ